MHNKMSPSYSTRYKRMVGGRPCIGFRLNLRRLSIRRLRARFLRFFGFLKRRFYARIFAFSSSSSSSKSSSSCFPRSGELNKASMRKRCESSEYCRMKSLGRTNSFYTEAIADCLEFIKRSSGASSLDISSSEIIPAAHLTSAPISGFNSI